MKTMKVLTLFCLLSLGFFCKSANAQMYIVTEKKVTGYIDSVYVTNPTGVTVKYQIPDWYYNIPGHDSQLSIILNGIINLGYKNMAPILFSTPDISYRVYYFAKPWTPASSELEQANNSQLSIKGFPNPTTGIVNLEINFANGYEPKEIVVINEGGFIIYTKHLEHIESGESVPLDLSNQSSGLYLITAKNSTSYSPLVKVIRN